VTGALTVLATGPMTTVQDSGRPGQAALGIGRSGSCDRAAAALANRLVGNPAGAAVLEVTFGGLVVRAETELTVVTTGARCAGATAHNAPVRLRAGQTLRLGPPLSGLRTYLGVRGGIDVPAVLGSRATDVLAGLGPAVVRDGDLLPVGTSPLPMADVDLAPVSDPATGEVTVAVLPGPRADWFGDEGWARLTGQAWTVTSESNRVGLRLDGDALERVRSGELPSEGMVRGALQVPPSGQPVLFLADHPVTGGYPVIGYVADDPLRSDVDRCAQLQPGQTVRFRGVPR
jgi:biotin-dependent carboxylase-like uncharacterized protein